MGRTEMISFNKIQIQTARGGAVVSQFYWRTTSHHHTCRITCMLTNKMMEQLFVLSLAYSIRKEEELGPYREIGMYTQS